MTDRGRLAAHVAYLSDRLRAGDGAADIIRDLVSTRGARFVDITGTYQLRLEGVTKSCTQGPASLLRGWLSKASVALEEVQ